MSLECGNCLRSFRRFQPAKARFSTPESSCRMILSKRCRSISFSPKSGQGENMRRRIIPGLRSARDGKLLDSRIGKSTFTKLKAGLNLCSPVSRFASLIFFSVPSGSWASVNVVVDEESLPNRLPMRSALVEVVDAARVYEVGADECNQHSY